MSSGPSSRKLISIDAREWQPWGGEQAIEESTRMAAVKMLPPAITIWWVDDGDQTAFGYEGVYGAGFADISAPTSAEVNAGINISCAMTTDFTLGWTDRDTDDTRGLCDDAAVANPTTKNYEATLNFFLDRDPNKVEESIYNEVLELFKKPLRSGYLVQRIARHPRREPDCEPGDRLTIFKVYSGDPNILNDATAPIQMEVVFYAQGESSDGIVQADVTPGS